MLAKNTPIESSNSFPSSVSEVLENVLFFTNLFPYIVSALVNVTLLSLYLNINLNFTVVPDFVEYPVGLSESTFTSLISKSYTISSASSPIPGTLIV